MLARIGNHQLAVAQHVMRSAMLQRLLERVANEDDRHARCLQPLHQREEMVLLLGRQRSGGLVEDDDARVVMTARAISTICLCAAPSVATSAVGSTWKFSDCRNCWAGDVDPAQCG